ncbi:hypothetical protein [Acinetobacter seifertii]|uniref:hypothetical protein n=1 Tax=Acinetobacter seifertii TaxID=1530123 RepID=UPI00124E51A3|nr:hypothetical protein [Acinetobacter seifertii]QNX15243.1 hypothetical protein IC793_15290 [Acinetobacter seifertii]
MWLIFATHSTAVRLALGKVWLIFATHSTAVRLALRQSSALLIFAHVDNFVYNCMDNCVDNRMDKMLVK